MAPHLGDVLVAVDGHADRVEMLGVPDVDIH
jgi:hypothetical protein